MENVRASCVQLAGLYKWTPKHDLKERSTGCNSRTQPFCLPTNSFFSTLRKKKRLHRKCTVAGWLVANIPYQLWFHLLLPFYSTLVYMLLYNHHCCGSYVVAVHFIDCCYYIVIIFCDEFRAVLYCNCYSAVLGQPFKWAQSNDLGVLIMYMKL